MDAHNLAIVFGPTLVRPQDNSMAVMVKDMADQCRVVETIIVHVRLFYFDVHSLFFFHWFRKLLKVSDAKSKDRIRVIWFHEICLIK